MSKIHSTAIISSQTEIAEGVSIGPFSVTIGKVKIGSGTKISSHVQIGNDYGKVTLGKNNELFKGSIVGSEPQDLSYKKEDTALIIGDGNVIREFANINTGTIKDRGITQVGNDCLIMVAAHVGHDCILGNNIVLGSQSSLAGHVIIEDNAIVCPMSGVVQFRVIGKNSYLIPYSLANKDVLPFSITSGNPAVLKAINKVGLERNNYSLPEIANIKKAFRYMTRRVLTVREAVAEIQSHCEDSENIQTIINFAQNSKNGIAR